MSVNLEAERMDRGLNTRDAATKIGIARGTLERAERGERVYIGSMKMIADFYEKKVTDIWPVGSHPERSAA